MEVHGDLVGQRGGMVAGVELFYGI